MAALAADLGVIGTPEESRMMAFVVGPSRAGKTTLLRQVLPRLPSVDLLDLDAEEHRTVGLAVSGASVTGGWEGRWQRDAARLAARAGRFGNVVVDVGAGSLQTPEGLSYFAARGYQTVVVTAPVRVVAERHPGRDMIEFEATEYSPERLRVYEAARFHVDTSAEYARCVEELDAALRSLMRKVAAR